MTKPCVRCLHKKVKRQRAGRDKSLCIIQCCECGFNVTSDSFADAEAQWNGFKVWSLVEIADDTRRAEVTN